MTEARSKQEPDKAVPIKYEPPRDSKNKGKRMPQKHWSIHMDKVITATLSEEEREKISQARDRICPENPGHLDLILQDYHVARKMGLSDEDAVKICEISINVGVNGWFMEEGSSSLNPGWEEYYNRLVNSLNSYRIEVNHGSDEIVLIEPLDLEARSSAPSSYTTDEEKVAAYYKTLYDAANNYVELTRIEIQDLAEQLDSATNPDKARKISAGLESKKNYLHGPGIWESACEDAQVNLAKGIPPEDYHSWGSISPDAKATFLQSEIKRGGLDESYRLFLEYSLQSVEKSKCHSSDWEKANLFRLQRQEEREKQRNSSVGSEKDKGPIR